MPLNCSLVINTKFILVYHKLRNTYNKIQVLTWGRDAKCQDVRENVSISLWSQPDTTNFCASAFLLQGKRRGWQQVYPCRWGGGAQEGHSVGTLQHSRRHQEARRHYCLHPAQPLTGARGNLPDLLCPASVLGLLYLRG